jgi:hypothetical protein
MNARDPNFVTDGSEQPPLADIFSVGRQDAIVVVNSGDLPITPGLHRVVCVSHFC